MRLLDRQTVELPPHRSMTVRACVRRVHPAFRALRLGRVRRGLTLVTGVPRNGFVPITDRAARDCERGFVVASALGRSFDRFHFHLVTTRRTPRAWRQRADGHVFRPFWARWDALPRLVAGQQVWLARMRGRLLESAVGPNTRP